MIIDPISQSITNHAHYVRLREKIKRASERASKQASELYSRHHHIIKKGVTAQLLIRQPPQLKPNTSGSRAATINTSGLGFNSSMAQLARHNQHIHMRGHHQGATHLSESPLPQHTSTSMPEDYSSTRAFKHRHDKHIHVCSHHLYSMQAAYPAAKHQRASTTTT